MRADPERKSPPPVDGDGPQVASLKRPQSFTKQDDETQAGVPERFTAGRQRIAGKLRPRWRP
jgi:hypothetical protein